MTLSVTHIQVMTLIKEIRRGAQQLWPSERRSLGDAALELGVDLELYACDTKCLHDKFAPFIGHYEQFVMFLKDSDFPRSWHYLHDSALNDISEYELLIAFAEREATAAEDLFQVETHESCAVLGQRYECAIECVIGALSAFMRAERQHTSELRH